MLQWAFLLFLLLLNLISSFLSSPTSSIALTAPWYMYVYECLCVCVYIRMNIFMYIYVHINTHRQMHINIHIHMFMYIYTQVHTHTEGGEKEGGERLLGMTSATLSHYYCLCFTCEVKNIPIFSNFSYIIQPICTESQSPVVFFQTSLSRSFCYS